MKNKGNFIFVDIFSLVKVVVIRLKKKGEEKEMYFIGIGRNISKK